MYSLHGNCTPLLSSRWCLVRERHGAYLLDVQRDATVAKVAISVSHCSCEHSCQGKAEEVVVESAVCGESHCHRDAEELLVYECVDLVALVAFWIALL